VFVANQAVWSSDLSRSIVSSIAVRISIPNADFVVSVHHDAYGLKVLPQTSTKSTFPALDIELGSVCSAYDFAAIAA
jgi:hypothetical protein